MASSNSPEKTYSLEQFIENGQGALKGTYTNLSIIDRLPYRKRDNDSQDELYFASMQLINDYIDEVKEQAVLVKLDHKEQLKYKYAPDLLSYDIYKTTEFAYIIMILNGIVDPDEFTMDKVYLLRRLDMSNLISDVYNAERNFIIQSRTDNQFPIEGM